MTITSMSPDLAFILTLVLRMAVTAAFVVSASVITERSGPVIGALVARRRPAREYHCFCDRPAAAAALSQRQDAADHALLVRYPAARALGIDAGGNRHDPVGLGRPQYQRHHRAVSGGVHQHDADSAPAHWRPSHRGRDRQQRMGADGAGP